MYWRKKRNRNLWCLYGAKGRPAAAVRYAESPMIVPIFGPVFRYHVYITEGTQLVCIGVEYLSLKSAQQAAEQAVEQATEQAVEQAGSSHN